MASAAAATLADWKARLDALLAAPRSDPGRLIRAICDLADAMGETTGEALLDACPELFEHAPALTAANRTRIVSEEIAEIGHLMQQAPPSGGVVIGDLLGDVARRAYDRVRDLFDHVEFGTCRRLVMVGCGRHPGTIFHIHDKTPIPEIVGLDIVPEVIVAVDALIARLGLTRFRAEFCDGRDYDYAGAEIVFVANLVSPKVAVFARIADTAPAHVQIVVREPYSLGRLWADGLKAGIDPRLETIGRGSGSRYQSRNVYLRKRIAAG